MIFLIWRNHILIWQLFENSGDMGHHYQIQLSNIKKGIKISICEEYLLKVFDIYLSSTNEIVKSPKNVNHN
jgi:hypothetical protein